MDNFESQLEDLIAKWRERGEDVDSIISAMEIQSMALEEEKTDDEK